MLEIWSSGIPFPARQWAKLSKMRSEAADVRELNAERKRRRRRRREGNIAGNLRCGLGVDHNFHVPYQFILGEFKLLAICTPRL